MSGITYVVVVWFPVRPVGVVDGTSVAPPVPGFLVSVVQSDPEVLPVVVPVRRDRRDAREMFDREHAGKTCNLDKITTKCRNV